MIDIRKRPMCWLAIGFLLIICVLMLGRSAEDVVISKELNSSEKHLNQRSGLESSGQNEKVNLEGIITSKEYKESAYGGYWQIVLKQVKAEIMLQEQQFLEMDGSDENIVSNKIISLEGKYLCQITEKENLDVKIGQRILLEAKYSSWESPTNEGQFDSAKYYISQGILGQFKKGKILKVGTDYDVLQEKMWQFRQNMQEILQQQLGERDGGLMGAMLLGIKSDLNQEDKSLYQRNGISHILAISGLHLSLLGMGIYKVLLRILPGRKQAAVLCILIMSLYCIFTGNSISTNRATIMFALSLVATILGRSYDSLSALGFTAILQLFTNPYVLNNSGFLLSFLAVIGVTFLSPRLQELFSCKKTFTKSLCVSLSASLTTLPVILTSYGTYPWYSVFLNLMVLPAMSMLLLGAVLLLMVAGVFIGVNSGMIVLMSGLDNVEGLWNWLMHWLLMFLKFVISGILKYFEICCEGFENLFFQDGYIGAPGWFAIIVYVVILLVVASDKIVNSVFFRKVLLLCALSILTMCFHVGLEITMLDVGQGDCVVIRNSNGNVYISDCGSSSVSKVGQYRLLPFLKYKGYGKIKGIFISHMDEDHMNGILELLEKAPQEHLEIEYVFLPESVLQVEEDRDSLSEIKSLASKNGIGIAYLSQGETIQDGKLRFRCLYPGAWRNSLDNLADSIKETDDSYFYLRKEDRNNTSLVMLLEYQEFEMLFTGDVEKEGELEIVRYMQESDFDNEIEVLKVAHHGSSGSSCEEFLDAFHPKLSLISCGKNNSYGHPHEETLERLNDSESETFVTTDYGSITLNVRKNKCKISTFIKKSIKNRGIIQK